MASECNNSGTGFNCSNFQDSSKDSNSIPSKEDLDYLYGPMYEEYYATRSPEVSDSFAAITLDKEDTLSFSSIVVEENEAPQIVTSSKEPVANEPTTLVSDANADESVQEDVAELDKKMCFIIHFIHLYSKKLSSISINRVLIQAIPTSLPLQPIREATKASNLQRIPPRVQGRSHFTYFLYLIVQITNPIFLDYRVTLGFGSTGGLDLACPINILPCHDGIQWVLGRITNSLPGVGTDQALTGLRTYHSIYLKISPSEEQVATEPHSPVLNENTNELIQEDDVEFDGCVFYNPPQTPVFKEAESSSTYQYPSDMHEFHQQHRSTDKWTKNHLIEQMIGDRSKASNDKKTDIKSDAEVLYVRMTSLSLN
ncbi:hypothetical protein Tco_0775050 [Tanacetum coccineum]